MPPDPHKLPRSPLRVALLTFLVVVAIGGAAGLVAFLALDRGNGRGAFASGEMLGQGVGTFAIICAGIAYVVQKSRVDRL